MLIRCGFGLAGSDAIRIITKFVTAPPIPIKNPKMIKNILHKLGELNANDTQ